MKKTLAIILALVMVLSVMSLTTLAADITVDGDVSEWTGWVNVSARDNESTNGTVQGTAKYGKVTASYDYVVKVVGDTLYIAYKQDVAAIGNEAPGQENCTYVRFWIDNDPSTTSRSGLIDFGFDGEKTVVVRNDCKKDGEAIAVTVAGKAGENSYSFEAAIKLADLGITDNNFRYAITASSPEYAVVSTYFFRSDSTSVTMNIPKDFLEANTEYKIKATAAFKNVESTPGSNSAFINFYYGGTWGDIFSINADAGKDSKEMTFTTGDTIETIFTCGIGSWGGAKGDISVYQLEVVKGDNVVWFESFDSIPEDFNGGELIPVLEYDSFHSIKYDANVKGSEPWSTTAGYTVYSDESVEEPETSVGEPETSVGEPETSVGETETSVGETETSVGETNPGTGDPMMVFALIALLTIAGTVVAVKKVR